MHRPLRSFALALLALAGLGAAPARAGGPTNPTPAGGSAASTGPRLNVVLISADTLRGDLLPMNGGTVSAPHLEALAAQGVNFRHAYANVTTTTPSHASLFSSLYPSDHGVWSNQDALPGEVVTLAQVLKAAGWHTAGIVNMPWMNPDVTGVTRGIDELQRGDRVRHADRTTAWVLDFLDRRAGEAGKASGAEPFFLFVHFVDNHTPYHAPGSFDRLYYPKDKDPRAGSAGSLQRAWTQFPKHHRDNPYFLRWIGDVTDADYVVGTYKGSITWLDLHVGRIVQRLKARGLWENTLLAFTADHGESLGEHGLWFTHGGLYQPTTRVPLVVRVPGGPSATQVDTVVDLVDVAPTLLARVGLALPGAPRGEDLWQLLGAPDVEGAALLEHTGRQLEGVVTPRWKLIRHLKTRTDIYPTYPIRKGRVELYDLRADPAERRDVARANPEVVAELTALLEKLKSGGHAFEAAPAQVDAQTEEALRSLGYVQ